MSVNYILAAYFGNRTRPTSDYTKDPASYLREHVSSLTRLNHSLDQITIGISGKRAGSLKFIPGLLKTSRVNILDRPNVGMSYGVFSDCFRENQDKFSYHIFAEDDYIFTQDDFDEILVKELESRPKCGMLCGAAYVDPAHFETRPVAAVYITISKNEALKKAAGLCPENMLPYDRSPVSYLGGVWGQREQSYAIQNAGYSVEDWINEQWSTAFYNAHFDGPNGVVRWFGRLDRPAFVVPVQSLDRETIIFHEGHTGFYTGNIQRNGTITNLTKRA